MRAFVSAPRSWRSAALELGFAPPGANGRRRRARGRRIRPGGVELVRNGMGLRARGDWLEAVELAPEGAAYDSPGLDSTFAAPGLWRSVGPGDSPARTFEIPPGVWDAWPEGDEADEPEASPGASAPALGALLDWAEATATGAVPPDWRAPAPEEVKDWLAARPLVVRAEAHVARGEVVCETGRLALRFPELVRPNPGLADAREAWLRALCRDTEARWRFVRVGVDDGAVRAEVDLTGVPAACARPLAQLSLEALVCAGEWVLPSLALVIDPSVESLALDRHPALDETEWGDGAPTHGGEEA